MLNCIEKQWKVAVGGTGWGCLTLAALIHEALGQRRVGVAVQPLFNTTTITVVVVVIIIIVITIVMTSVMMITQHLSL